MNRLIRAAIDTHALRHNLQVIRERARGARVMAMVKGQRLRTWPRADRAGARGRGCIGVARLEEGLALRAAGITQPIVLLEGVFAPEHLWKRHATVSTWSSTTCCRSSCSRKAPVRNASCYG